MERPVANGTPWHVTFRKKVAELVNELGWEGKELAHKIGWNPSSVSRYLRGEMKECPADKIDAIASVLGRTVAELCTEDRCDDGHQRLPGVLMWNPRFESPRASLEITHEHQTLVPEAITYNRTLNNFTMTDRVIKNHHLSKLGGGPEAKVIRDAMTMTAVMRRQWFQSGGYEVSPLILTLMRRSDLIRLVTRKRPYDLCSPQEIAECLDDLRRKWVVRWRYRLALIPDRKLRRETDLMVDLRGRDSLTIIGRTLEISRLSDWRVEHSERRRDVEWTKDALLRLKHLAGLGPTETPNDVDVLRVLDRYQEYADQQVALSQGRQLSKAAIDICELP